MHAPYSTSALVRLSLTIGGRPMRRCTGGGQHLPVVAAARAGESPAVAHRLDRGPAHRGTSASEVIKISSTSSVISSCRAEGRHRQHTYVTRARRTLRRSVSETHQEGW